MNEMQVFSNPEFGSIRTIEGDGKVLFCASDVAKALGYAKPQNAVSAHCKGALKRGIPTNGGLQEMTFIPESDIYRLVPYQQIWSEIKSICVLPWRNRLQHSSEARMKMSTALLSVRMKRQLLRKLLPTMKSRKGCMMVTTYMSIRKTNDTRWAAIRSSDTSGAFRTEVSVYGAAASWYA